MLIEGIQLGPYRIISFIGSGSIGDVYLAENRHSHQQGAIKILRTALVAPDTAMTEDTRRLFLQEVKAIFMLNHPHILPLSDYGEASIDGNIHVYFSMPFRPVGSLEAWSKQHEGVLPLQAVIAMVSQAAEALQHVHNYHIIHRNVKPSNFLLCKMPDNLHALELQLTDFKLATFANTTIDSAESSNDSHSVYIAPEQREGKAVYATDQYALAVVAYQFLTNRTPFEDEAEQPLNGCIVPPSKVNPQVSEQLDSIFQRALQKKPEDRYPSISAFASAFEEAAKKIYTQTTQREAVKEAHAMTTIVDTPKEAHAMTTIVDTPKEAHAMTTVVDATAIDLPGETRGSDIHVQVYISKREAKYGTTRSLALPGERSAAIAIPASTKNGQVFRLEGEGEPSAFGGPAGALIVTVIINTESGNGNFLPPATSPYGTRTILLTGLAVLLLANALGLWYFFGAGPFKSVVATAVSSTATVQANATATVIRSQYPFSNTLGLDDPLIDNTRGYGWVESNFCTFTAGTYRVHSDPGSYSDCVAANKTFNNFTFQIQMTILKGDCGGILFRGNDGSSKYYFFLVCQDGSYLLTLHTGVGRQVLAQHSSPAINKGLNQPNIIAVVASGSILTLYANNHLLFTVKDNTYRVGQIGVLADPQQNSTEVAYSSAKIWIL